MKKLIVLLLLIFTTPSFGAVLSDSDFNGTCGTYHVLTAVFVQVVTCSAGTYLPANATSCSTCPSGYYCAGGTFDVGSTDQGKVLDRYTCSAGYFLPAATRACTACPSGFTCAGGTYGYNATNSQGLDYTSNYYTTNLAYACAANMPHVMTAVFGRDCAAGTYMPKNSSTCTACPSGYTCPGGAYAENSSVDQGKVLNCSTALTITTSSTNSFQFKMSTTGEYRVDCGTGGTLSGTGVSASGINRTTTTEATYTCSYSDSAARTIQFCGNTTGYNTGGSTPAIRFNIANTTTDANAPKIASVTGSLSTLFPYKAGTAQSGAQPRFYRTFFNATGLTSVPDTLFTGYTTPSTYMFYQTFGYTGLTSIPENLFQNITGSADYLFTNTFDHCTGVSSISENLFKKISGAATAMFQSTFYNCTGLTDIPEDLFKGVTGGAQQLFTATFRGCTGLTSIPENLFKNVSSAGTNMFGYTFYDCSNITGYIPKSTFLGLVNNSSPVTTNMWNQTFSGTQLVSTCPSGTTAVTSGYYGTNTSDDSYAKWGNYAMCEGTTGQDCSAGYYLPANANACLICPANSYCGGGIYTPDTTAQGITACTTGLYSPAGASVVAQCGRILRIGNDTVYLRSAKKTATALNIDIDQDGTADFFGNLTTTPTYMNSSSTQYVRIQWGNNDYYLCDDTTCP